MADLHLHLHFPPDPRIDQILSTVKQLQTSVQTEGAQVATAEEVLANLQSAASRTADVQQSVILMLNQLHAEVVAAVNGGNWDAVQAVAQALSSGADAVAAAIVSDTPPSAQPQQPAPTGTDTGAQTPPATDVGAGTPSPSPAPTDTGTAAPAPPDSGLSDTGQQTPPETPPAV